MFFPERIVSIKDNDRVLEVGPGGSPHPRSDVLLEKKFNGCDAREQRGGTPALKTEKEVVFYEEKKFPFEDNEFDYVICSHVLEHVPSNEICNFLSEIQRVGKKGYLEFPTIYYDYIYNFPKHLTFLLYEGGTIKYLGKEQTQIHLFQPVQDFFYNSAVAGHKSLTKSLKEYYFQGFEWQNSINAVEARDVKDVVYAKEIIENITVVANSPLSFKGKIKNKLSIYMRAIVSYNKRK